MSGIWLVCEKSSWLRKVGLYEMDFAFFLDFHALKGGIIFLYVEFLTLFWYNFNGYKECSRVENTLMYLEYIKF